MRNDEDQVDSGGDSPPGRPRGHTPETRRLAAATTTPEHRQGNPDTAPSSTTVEVPRVEYDELVLWRDVISHTECWRRIQLARALLSQHGHTAQAALLADRALCGEDIPKPRKVAT